MYSIYIKSCCSGAQRVNQLKTLNSFDNCLIAICCNCLHLTLSVALFSVFYSTDLPFHNLNGFHNISVLPHLLKRIHYRTSIPKRWADFFVFKFLSSQWKLLRSVHSAMSFLARVFRSKLWLLPTSQSDCRRLQHRSPSSHERLITFVVTLKMSADSGFLIQAFNDFLAMKTNKQGQGLSISCIYIQIWHIFRHRNFKPVSFCAFAMIKFVCFPYGSIAWSFWSKEHFKQKNLDMRFIVIHISRAIN